MLWLHLGHFLFQHLVTLTSGNDVKQKLGSFEAIVRYVLNDDDDDDENRTYVLKIFLIAICLWKREQITKADITRETERETERETVGPK